MREPSIALGFYDDLATANGVIHELSRKGLGRIAKIRRTSHDRLSVRRYSSFRYFPSIAALLIGVLPLLLVIWPPIAVVGVGFLEMVLLSFIYRAFRIEKSVTEKFKEVVGRDEVVVIAQVDPKEFRPVSLIMRDVKGGHPVTFLLRSPIDQQPGVMLPNEPLSVESLRKQARAMAESLVKACAQGKPDERLLDSLKRSERVIQEVKYDIAESEYLEQAITNAGERLLDNSYIVQASIENIRKNLPTHFYRELPIIVHGNMTNLPRVYAIAVDIVESTAGKLNRENLIEYLNSYQTIQPLTMGELWAIPLMLRLRLVECVESLSIEIENQMREEELTRFWGYQILKIARSNPEKIQDVLKSLSKEEPQPTPLFAEGLLDHLFDEESVIPVVRSWLQERFPTPITDLIHQEQMREAAHQVAFANAITSLFTLAQIAWPTVFEAVSLVDACLREDPIGIYEKMQFSTRNEYRKTIETFSRYSTFQELDIAKMALEMSKVGEDEVSRHIGYYLVDRGVDTLAASIQYHPTRKRRFTKWIKDHSAFVYLGSIGLLTLLGELLLLHFSTHILMPILALWPILEVSVQFVNLMVTKILSPKQLSKMSYEKEGVPDSCKSIVVVPMLLLTPQSIKSEVAQLEIHYLANNDPNLYFGLLTDFTDAPEQHREDDALLLDCAVKGIESLEQKYGPGKFFLFHRDRVWSASEKAWIGWERKRGKLEYLNDYLLTGKSPDKFVYVGVPEKLQGVKYVITLDADTQLPKDKARHLIETISHPLNVPRLSSDGRSATRGYTIIQPRVNTTYLNTYVTRFCSIFSDPPGVDPYTQAISDVYQDLTGEGAYHGKGIYDVAAFTSILKGRFPDEQILSHDLLEGAYVRTAYASDISLFDNFPEDYLLWCKRQHRWVRGDWQIIDWLFRKVPVGTGKEKNPLSLINRWKIFDNLRRSLLPASIILLLIADWLYSSYPLPWTLLAAVTLLIPVIIIGLLNISFKRRVNMLSWHDINMAIERCLIAISLLPHQAWLNLDAIARVFFRRYISHHHLLEWTTSKMRFSSLEKARFMRRLVLLSLFSLAAYLAVYFFRGETIWLAFPFCLLWFVAPLVVALIDMKPVKRSLEELSQRDRRFLRIVSRKTWRYFDDFVGPHSNWLPPDNYQSAIKIEIAQRTSPTNIGLWLLTALSAYDFKYITIDELVERVLGTVQTLEKLERFEGHLLNWYDTEKLTPLYPRYISTVDSGNFLASVWALEQGLNHVLEEQVVPKSVIEGIVDTLDVLMHEEADHPQLLELRESLEETSDPIQTIRKVHKQVQELSKVKITDNIQSVYWLRKLENQIESWERLMSRYLGWMDVLASIPHEVLLSLDVNAPSWRKEALEWIPSLKQIAGGEYTAPLKILLALALKSDSTSESQEWGKRLQDSLANSQWLAGEKLGQVKGLMAELQKLSEEINLRFLYNDERKLFVIGYNVDERRLDNSFYDLLASEARLASFTSIAKEEVPVEHWWTLGRPYGMVDRRRVLLSWGGTMFEYLMPLLFTKNFSESLLGEACDAAVACQQDYGSKLGIPWGISEAAYSEIDAHKTYQYRSFGVPGLGLKRNLEEDLVVSPYSTALALLIDPAAAVENLKKMKQKGAINLDGNFGFYESIDFSRQHGPSGERGVIVYAYFAHHQGMSFLALNNVLHHNIMTKRYHADPRVKGIEFLLYEHIPISPPIATKDLRKEIPISRLTPISLAPTTGVIEKPESLTPKVNLLSNGEYSLMITNSGGGYSRWRGLDITRWRSDTTTDAWGSFIYIKDMKSHAIWSATYQPVRTRTTQYTVNFKPEKAEFRRRDYQIDMLTEILVSAEDQAEIRLVRLVNHSSQTRYLELTSYMELVLAVHAADVAHPAFNKLFIETELLPDMPGLLAYRRKRSPEENSIWAAHVIACSQELADPIQFETDRNRFIGRGRAIENPQAFEGDLSNISGAVLDPIFSMRCRLVLEPGRLVHVAFVTAVADNRVSAVSLVEKYKNLDASIRANQLAWTYAQLELRHLRMQQDEAQLFQKLAGYVLYPQNQLRASAERLRSNRLGQSGLWSHGISGDLPIIVVTVGDIYETDLVRQVLVAHSFWRLRGLKTDLVILNDEAFSYQNPLQEQLRRMISAYTYHDKENVPGGIYLLHTDQMKEEEQTLLLSAASIVLVSARGPLSQQLTISSQSLTYPPALSTKPMKDFLSPLLPFLELSHFNGFGGFSKDGRAYVMYLEAGRNTPSPWINVIANQNFGTMVSEAGIGCTWYGNSQNNRLTPWSNDPVLDPIADCVYIRDEELGAYWTATPKPIRENDAYRIHHSQGFTHFEHNSHGLEQKLEIFVPVDDKGGLPLRIQRLRIRNRSNQRRRLTVTSYTEWVLGTQKEETQIHIITDWDPESNSIFAVNRYNPHFGSWVAFSTSLPLAASYTGDRTEFLGRNSTVESPAALTRKELSGRCGTALDPCAALQVNVELDIDQEKEVIFILGYAEDGETARKLIAQYRSNEGIEKLFVESKAWWDNFFGALQVEVPEDTTNFLINHWLLYQDLSCRFWGRTAFYQSSGAYGFRDQLQDVLALLYTKPEMAREHLLRAASRQFVEGDVQHWWHPPQGEGVRTRISDDLLWLPFAVAQYVRVTGDTYILNENVPFIQAPLLKDDQQEAYQTPEVSSETATLLEHCRRAIQRSLKTGPHDLPLMGTGDWNDGMNHVGIKGTGESVWLAWFLIHVLQDFSELLELTGQQDSAQVYRDQIKKIAQAAEAHAWDGAWYRRAYFDDGSPLGSKENPESKIDSLAQSWAVISGAGDPERCRMALQSTEELLVKYKEKLILLLTPPFDKAAMDPGYIKGYPPGIRENGSQYTHGSSWVPMAFARMGDGDKAVALLNLMKPISHAETYEDALHYEVEPYVLAGDINSLVGNEGRGGWTWYSGSAGWMYRIWLEEILGFKLRGETLQIDCTIPKNWDRYKIHYRYRNTNYSITVENPHHLNRGKPDITLDGKKIPGNTIPLVDDKASHDVVIILDKIILPLSQ